MLGWGWYGPEECKKYSCINVLASQAMHSACNDTAEYDLLMNTIEGIISRRQGYDKCRAYGPRSSVDENAIASQAS